MCKGNRHEREITARPRSRFAPVTSFIRWIYGRFYFNRVKRNCKHLGFFRRYGRVLAFYVVWLSPLAALTAEEWTRADIDSILHEVGSIEDWNSSIFSQLQDFSSNNYNKLGEINQLLIRAFGFNYPEAYPNGYLAQISKNFATYFGYDTDGVLGRLNLNLETYGQNLYNNQREIVTKLESIISLLSGNSGSGSAAEINQNWLTEAKYTEVANQFLTSWGFEGGSAGSFKQSFDMLVGTQTSLPSSYTLTYYTAERDVFTPFPDADPRPFNKIYWYDLNEHSITFDLNEIGYLGMLNYNMQYMHNTLSGASDALVNNMKKSSWNDWYAHTNLVATIVQQADRFFHAPSDDNTNTTFSDGKLITVTTSGGSSNTNEEDLTPVTTNDFAQIEQDTNSVTNSLKFLSADKIKSRYLTEGMGEVGEFNDKYSSEGSSFNTVWDLGGFRMDFSEHFDKYRILVPVSTLSKFRDGMSWLWRLAMVAASFWFVLKIANVNSSGDN